jgi:hypothetical protein
MTTSAPPRALELPPVTLTARPLRLDLPRFQRVATTPPAAAPAPTHAPAPAPTPPPAPTVPPAAPAPAVAPPTSIAPVVATPSLTRRDGTIGLAVGILVITIVLAAALAMQRSMHGGPPGMH